MSQSNYVRLDVAKIKRETDAAFLLRLEDGSEHWIPKSHRGSGELRRRRRELHDQCDRVDCRAKGDRNVIVNPRIGQRVQLWYAKALAHLWPLHGKFGRVAIVGKGKPRNHGVGVDGRIVVVPCGNLREPKE